MRATNVDAFRAARFRATGLRAAPFRAAPAHAAPLRPRAACPSVASLLPALPALVLLASAGCSDVAGRGEPVAVRDSAGVAIVEFHGALPVEDEWSVDVAGGLRLPGEFFRVQGAFRFPDGRITVADGGSRELRFFASDGAPEGAVGGAGEGPGEFRALTAARRWPGDSIVVFDIQARRLTLFDDAGGWARTFQFQTTEEAPFASLEGVFADGSMLATGFTQTGDGGPENGRQRYRSPAYHFRPDGSLVEPLPLSTANESYFEILDGGFRVWEALFPLNRRLLAGPETLVEAEAEAFRLRIHTPSGALVRIIRWLDPPSAITESMRRAAVDRKLEAASSGTDLEAYRRLLENMELPEKLPAFGRLAVDRSGAVWVEEFEADPDPGSESEWIVFGTEGDVRARVRLPRRLEPMEIGDDYVLGVLTDAFDVEQVVLAELRR